MSDPLSGNEPDTVRPAAERDRAECPARSAARSVNRPDDARPSTAGLGERDADPARVHPRLLWYQPRYHRFADQPGNDLPALGGAGITDAAGPAAGRTGRSERRSANIGADAAGRRRSVAGGGPVEHRGSGPRLPGSRPNGPGREPNHPDDRPSADRVPALLHGHAPDAAGFANEHGRAGRRARGHRSNGARGDRCRHRQPARVAASDRLPGVVLGHDAGAVGFAEQPGGRDDLAAGPSVGTAAGGPWPCDRTR